MSKYRIGTQVKYSGTNNMLSGLLPYGLTVIDSASKGMFLGNGEYNTGKETIYRCRSNLTGVLWLFRESELSAVSV